jgi:3-dehydroquinate dehydratase-2
MRFLLVNGPNLNSLGTREPHIYGHDTLFDIVTRVEKRAAEFGATIDPFQSNHEGAIIDFLQEHARGADGLIINPGGLAHTSVVLRDAISASQLPAVEVHISNVHARESFRHESILTAVCKGMVTGLGWRGYIYALEALVAAAEEASPKQ